MKCEIRFLHKLQQSSIGQVPKEVYFTCGYFVKMIQAVAENRLSYLSIIDSRPVLVVMRGTGMTYSVVIMRYLDDWL